MKLEEIEKIIKKGEEPIILITTKENNDDISLSVYDSIDDNIALHNVLQYIINGLSTTQNKAEIDKDLLKVDPNDMISAKIIDPMKK